MSKGTKIKRDIQLVIISVIVLTLVTLNVSYSAFFSVQSQSTVQEISTGTLDVSIDSTSSAMSSDELFPTPESELPTTSTSVVDGSYAKLDLTNTGTLTADFSITIGYDTLPSGKTEEDLIAFNYLNIGIFDVSNNVWVNFGTETSPVYYTPITGLTTSEPNVYPILRDTLDATLSRQFKVYIWLSESTPISDIGKLVYLKLNVKSVTVEGHVEG